MNLEPQPTMIREVLGSACLVLALAMITAVVFLNPYGSSENQAHVARTQASALTAYSMTWFLASLLLVAGAATVVGRVRQRGSTLALIGGSLAVTGAVASAAIAVFESVAITLSAAIPADAELESVISAFDSAGVLTIVFLLWAVGTVIGWPLLFIGASRARLLSAWYAVPVLAGLVAQSVLTGASPTTLKIGISVLLAAPFVVLAYRIVRQPSINTLNESLVGAPVAINS